MFVAANVAIVMLSSDDRLVKRFRVYPSTEESLKNKHQIQSALMGVKAKKNRKSRKSLSNPAPNSYESPLPIPLVTPLRCLDTFSTFRTPQSENRINLSHLEDTG